MPCQVKIEFQRRHFEFLAAQVMNARRWMATDDANRFAYDLAQELQATNGQFKYDRFLQACGVPGPGVDE